MACSCSHLFARRPKMVIPVKGGAGGGEEGDSEFIKTIYFERQQFALCGVHVVNDILGRKRFSARDFDRFADELQQRLQMTDETPAAARTTTAKSMFACFNPSAHNSSNIGSSHSFKYWIPRYGNYDINVIMLSLQKERLVCSYWDKRNKIADDDLAFVCEVSEGGSPAGLIVNLSSTGGGAHWIAIKYIRGKWYNMDSNQFEQPKYPFISCKRE